MCIVGSTASLLHTGQEPTGVVPVGDLEDRTFEGVGNQVKGISKQKCVLLLLLL